MSNPQTDNPQPPKLVPYYWAGNLPLIEADWLVAELFPSKSLNLIVGESQAGKSYLALDLAVAMATGRPFLGKPVIQSGVLYIATEGQITIRRRLMAARQGLPLDEKLVAVIQEPPADLMNSEDVDRIIATAMHINEEMLKATELPLRMIIIDTMISGFTIGDWNSVADTSDAMKVLRRIKDEVGAAVTAVHHHGKDASRGAAGSYALTAHPDAILSVFKTDKDGAVKRRWAALTKSRFGETGRKIGFDLQKKCPDNRDGDADDEAFVVLSRRDTAEAAEFKSGGSILSKGDECFQSSCEAVLEEHGRDFKLEDESPVRAVRLSTVKQRFVELYKPRRIGGDPAQATNRAWSRALAKSRTSGSIHHGDKDGEEWVYIVKGSVPDSDLAD